MAGLQDPRRPAGPATARIVDDLCPSAGITADVHRTSASGSSHSAASRDSQVGPAPLSVTGSGQAAGTLQSAARRPCPLPQLPIRWPETGLPAGKEARGLHLTVAFLATVSLAVLFTAAFFAGVFFFGAGSNGTWTSTTMVGTRPSSPAPPLGSTTGEPRQQPVKEVSLPLRYELVPSGGKCAVHVLGASDHAQGVSDVFHPLTYISAGVHSRRSVEQAESGPHVLEDPALRVPQHGTMAVWGG